MRARNTARWLAVGLTAALVVSACGNSPSSKSSDSTSPPVPTGPSGEIKLATADELAQNLPNDSPGVTDTEIKVTSITDTTNILGGHYAELNDGIQAYFDMINEQGGIYGRKLKIAKKRDSAMVNNQTEVKASLAEDDAFATFVATVQLTGAKELEKAKQPTFVWNINPQFAGPTNLFGNMGAICFAPDCVGQGVPALAKRLNADAVGILAYGVSDQSKNACEANKFNMERFTPEIKVGFFDVNIQYAQPDLSAQVDAMKKAGVDLVFTCMDQKETLILGKEMQKQGLNAVQAMPNSYDAEFIADNAAVYEGSYVTTQFVPFEKDEASIPALAKQFQTEIAKTGKTVYELTIYGWILAHQFVTGLKIAGPEFTQQKLIDGLNRVKNYNAEGMIVPIDWTKQHRDPAKDSSAEGDYECSSTVKIEGGKFVPVFDQPGKPWICQKGGPEATTLTTEPDYMNFEGQPLVG